MIITSQLIFSASVADAGATSTNSLHEFKLSVWRNETDAVFRLKLAQLDTLMKLAVVNGDRRLARPTHRHHDNDTTTTCVTMTTTPRCHQISAFVHQCQTVF